MDNVHYSRTLKCPQIDDEDSHNRVTSKERIRPWFDHRTARTARSCLHPRIPSLKMSHHKATPVTVFHGTVIVEMLFVVVPVIVVCCFASHCCLLFCCHDLPVNIGCCHDLPVTVGCCHDVLLTESIVMVASYLLLDGISTGLTRERFRNGSHVALWET